MPELPTIIQCRIHGLVHQREQAYLKSSACKILGRGIETLAILRLLWRSQFLEQEVIRLWDVEQHLTKRVSELSKEQ